MKKIIILLMLLSAGFVSKAQCPYNLDAVDTTWTNWLLYPGTCVSGTGSLPTFTTYPGPVAYTTVVPLRFEMTSGAGLDQYAAQTGYYTLPVICPLIPGNIHSLKIGNDASGNQADKIRYKYHVPPTFDRFFAQFYYAFVLNSGGSSHSVNDQPRFTISVLDSATGLPVNCNFFELVIGATGANSGDSVFLSPSTTDVYYKRWTPATINLKNMQGKTVYFEFESTDCAFGGHFGYGYVDFTGCSRSVIQQIGCYAGTVTQSNDTLVGPKHSSFASMRWYKYPPFITANEYVSAYNKDTLVIPPIATVDSVYVLISPLPGFGCIDTFMAIITPPTPPVAAYINPSTYCSLSTVQFVDSSYITTLGDFVNRWVWNFGDNSGLDSSQNVNHIYTANGVYTASLIVSTHNGCKSDTTYHTININRTAQTAAFVITQDTICAPYSTTTITLTNTVPVGSTYNWTYPGMILVSSTTNSITLKGITVGNFPIGIHLVPPPGDTTCDFFGTTSINVKGFEPPLFLDGVDSICLHDVTTINISSKPANCGPSTAVCAAPSIYSIGTNSSTFATSNPTPFYGFFTEEKIQMIYTAAELGAIGFNGGQISELAFEILTKNSTAPYQNFNIKLACVPYTDFPATSAFDQTTTKTTVYSNASYNTFVGVNNFVFNVTNYDWDGVSSLLVEVCFDNGSSNWTGADYVKKTSLGSGIKRCVYAYSDNDPLVGCDNLYDGNTMYPATFTGNSDDRPDITLKGCNAVMAPSVVITWASNPAPFSPVVLQPGSASVAPLVNTDYFVSASDNGCTNTQTFHVEQMTKNFLHSSNDTTVCAGGVVTLSVSGIGPVPAIPVPCSINTTGGCNGTPLAGTKIGTGTGLATYSPFDRNYDNEHYIARYSAASILASFGGVPGPKILTSLALNVKAKNTIPAIPNFTISMQCVPSSYVLPTSTFPTGGSIVRSPSSFTSVIGWNTFNFTSPYNWDGVSDLLVEFCTTGPFDAADDVEATTMPTNCVMYAVNSSTPAGCNITSFIGSSSSGVSNSLPNIKFNYCNFPVNVGALNYHWRALGSTNMSAVNVNNDSITLAVSQTETFEVTLLGTSLNPFCPVRDTVVVHVANALASNPSNDTIVCKGSPVLLHNQLLTTGLLVDSIKWSTDYTPKHLLTSNKGATVTDSSYVSHHVYSTIHTNLGCFQTDTIFIYNPVLPKDTFTTINPVCLGANSTLTYTGNGTAAFNYIWSLDAGSNPPSDTLGSAPLNVSWSIPGPKSITLTIDTMGCTTTHKDSVYVVPMLDASFTLNKHAICAGDAIIMTYAGNSSSIVGTTFTPTATGGVLTQGTNISLSPNTYTYATPGTYYLSLSVVYAGGICAVTYIDSIIVYPIPTSNFTINKTDICSGDNVVISYNGTTTNLGTAASYAWNFDNPTSLANGTIAANVDTLATYTNINSTVSIKNISLTVTQNGCVSLPTTHSLNVHVIPVANIDLSEVITCSQISISLSQNSLVENPANANYIWTSTPLPTIPSSTTFSGLGQVGPHAIEYSNDTSLVKTFAMLQIIENGCTSNVAVDSVEVFPIPISSFRVIPDKICSGQPTTFVFDGVIDTTCTNCPVNYAWSFPDGLPNTATGNSVAVIFQNATDFTAPKVGELRVTQKYTKGSTTLTCPGNNGAKPYTAPVMVHPLPKIEFAGPIEICDKATTYLSTSVKYVKYLWNDGTTNDTCIVNHGGDYAVQVTDINKCVNNAITHVTVHPIPVANAGDDQLIFVGNSAFLSASKSYGGDSYLWTPKTTVDDATTMNPIVSPTATTAYVLTYYNAAVGCTDYDTVVIKVRDCEPLIVPNAFTPNGDNIDDNFMILNPNDYYRLIRMEIYNRWGELVYATNDKNNKGWDGMYRGSAQEVGTYIYHITAECGGGKLLNLKGDVTLLK